MTSTLSQTIKSKNTCPACNAKAILTKDTFNIDGVIVYRCLNCGYEFSENEEFSVVNKAKAHTGTSNLSTFASFLSKDGMRVSRVATSEKVTTSNSISESSTIFPSVTRAPSIRHTPRTKQGYVETLFLVSAQASPLHMLLIPGGTFSMGSPDNEIGRYDREGPQHEISVPQFLMGRYPITQAQWKAVADLPKIKRALNPFPSRFPSHNHPVEQVSWHEASEFCDRLAKYSGRPYRLPTEAEWEYACRAGTTTPFYFGKLMSTEVANFKGTSEKNLLYTDIEDSIYRQSTVAVDHFGIANRFGLSDMHGNVWEWCQELWSESHNPNQTRTKKSAATQSSEEYRMARGGSWYSTPERCRSASRFHFPSTVGHHDVGFRVACTYP